MSTRPVITSAPTTTEGHDLFDICGPLPTGTTVLEASAGTGKTFTIAALAARYVAGGMPLANLLLVTFTKMATGELRERVRERLVTAERGLAHALVAGPAVAGDDRVLRLLAEGDHDEVDGRRRNLAVALADFDAATIATTHGFCQHILSGLGVAGDVERDVTFVEDATDLVEEVVDDLYLRKFWRHPDLPAFDRAQALRIGKVAVANPQAPLEPRAADPKSTEAMRQRLADAVRREVEVRKRRLKILTYDDLLTRLAATLRDPERGPAACARLRERYRVALVDEFQDTDPVQWEIMRRAFGDHSVGDPDSDATLVLIGDPKQAIYAFRGADVYAYLDARRTAATRATLGTNWRSDQGLLDALDGMLSGTRLGHPEIGYRTVAAPPAHLAPRLVDAPHPSPLRVRVSDRADGFVERTPNGYAKAPSARHHVAADLAGDVVTLLSGKPKRADRAHGAERLVPVSPGDIAVLVRTHRQASIVRDALCAVGVPTVVTGAGSVFAAPMARTWLTLLEALERPSSAPRAHAVALTPFFGWTATRVATADDASWEDVYARLHRWAGVLRRRGVASLLEAVTASEALPGRLLACPDGERAVTDLRHLGQLLHVEAVASDLGITALAAWLRLRMGDAGEDTASEDRSRRLDSDADAVQVLTIHRSKGLEFPIVYFPFLWDMQRPGEDEPVIFHDRDHDFRRTVDVGLGGVDFARHRQQAVDEQRGEDLRLLYVALTRARHQAVVYWSSSWDSRNSPLGRLVRERDAQGDVGAEGTAVPDEREVREWFGAIATEAPGCVSVETTTGGDGRPWEPDDAHPGPLSVTRFDRQLDRAWRRVSYSSITAGAHEQAVHDATVASEADDVGITDEEQAGAAEGTSPPVGGAELVGDDEAMFAVPAEIDGSTSGTSASGQSQSGTSGSGRSQSGSPTAAVADETEARLRAVPSPLAAMPGGTAVGSFIHAVFETTDFVAADLDAALAKSFAAEHARLPVALGDTAAVLAGLRAAIETPLGPLVGDTPLRAVGRADRLDELSFELPLAGGDRPSGILTVEAIADLLRERLPADDILAGYPDHLAVPELARDLRGYLNGSIDVVLRVHDAAGTPRFAVVDYKTNWLGAEGEELTAWHYRPAALVDAMQRAHYPLQALLYGVALHRFLRWRLPGYHPDRNLAGVLYLFVRGMTGHDGPTVDGHPCGVFAWQPPAGLIGALSDLLDEGVRP